MVDANQSWTVADLRSLGPAMAKLDVSLLEQPVAVGQDEGLAGLDCPVPICADESIQTVDDLPRLVGRYDFINIKLDKTGGLTAALDLARAAQRAGLRLMSGCMAGSSLAMAPAMVLAQILRDQRSGRPLAAGRGLAGRHRLSARRNEPALAGILGLSCCRRAPPPQRLCTALAAPCFSANHRRNLRNQSNQQDSNRTS